MSGGHREPGETIEETARRELYEETGALRYTIEPLGTYPEIQPALLEFWREKI